MLIPAKKWAVALTAPVFCTIARLSALIWGYAQRIFEPPRLAKFRRVNRKTYRKVDQWFVWQWIEDKDEWRGKFTVNLVRSIGEIHCLLQGSDTEKYERKRVHKRMNDKW